MSCLPTRVAHFHKVRFCLNDKTLQASAHKPFPPMQLLPLYVFYSLNPHGKWDNSHHQHVSAGTFLVEDFCRSVGRTSTSCFCLCSNIPWYLLKESNKQVDHDDVLHKEVDSLEERCEEGARRTVFIGFTDWKWRTYRAWLAWKSDQSTAVVCARHLPQQETGQSSLLSQRYVTKFPTKKSASA